MVTCLGGGRLTQRRKVCLYHAVYVFFGSSMTAGTPFHSRAIAPIMVKMSVYTLISCAGNEITVDMIDHITMQTTVRFPPVYIESNLNDCVRD